ncbi:MAG: response regulator transcription factor [Myxococcota bacterium]|nr:response regulator transcription factor [Myxococcota bacterium]
METSILLADDQAIFREAMKSLIERRGDLYVVGEASDGQEALDLALRVKPDVVISEMCLPKLSGVEVAHRIRRTQTHTRVLILSSTHGRGQVREALRAGAAGFVSKSDSSAELLQAIDSLRQDRSYLSPTVSHHVVEVLTGEETDPEGALSQLTSREREVLQLIAEGLSSKEIADELELSTRTVETHRSHIMEKIGIHKVSSLVRFAIREGLVKP